MLDILKNLLMGCVSAIVVVFSSMSAFADTYTWSLTNADTGALVDGTFATPGNWTLSDGNVATEAPGEDDDVIIPSSSAEYTVTVGSAFKVKSLTVGDNSDASAVVTLEFSVKVTKDQFVGDVVEDVVVGAKGKLTHTAVASTAIGNTDYKLNLRAGSDITIKSGGSVSATNRGFAAGKGPLPAKRTGGDHRGGAHGGVGEHGNDSIIGYNSYGSIRNPVEPGSGGGDDKGGGVICIVAGGNLAILGGVYAQGANASGINNAAGGSIILKGNTLSGTGTITVQGGRGGTYPGGGGGRIAIYTNEAKEFSQIPFSANVSAACGAVGKGSCGTIYFESANYVPTCGELIIDGKSQTSGKYTYITKSVTDRLQPFGKVTVKSGARLSINDFTLTVTKAISVQNSNSISTAKRHNGTSNGGICISPPAGETFSYTYTDSGTKLTVDSLVCNVTEGATIQFKNSSSIAIAANGNLELNGAPDNLLKLVPATEAGVWSLTVGAGASTVVSYIDIYKCNASSGLQLTALDSVGDDYSKEHNVLFPSKIYPGDPLVWTGAADTSWVNPLNWLDKDGLTRAPLETDSITIPAGCPKYPRLIEDTLVNTLTNASGATITLANGNLTVTNFFTSAGNILRTTTERLILSGEGDATLDFANVEYDDIFITKSDGTIFMPNGLTAKRLVISSSAATTFVMPAAKKIAVNVFDVDGTDDNFITFVSSNPGTQWKLSVADVMRVRGVAVSDSDATEGRTIAVGDFASDMGRNSDWDFASGSAVEWVGGVDNNWTTAENWSPVGVPSETAVVAIRPKSAGATITLNSSSLIVPLGGLMVGGSEYTTTLTCNKAIDVDGGVEFGEKATIYLNSLSTNNIVGGNMYVRSSATVTHTGPQYSNTQLYGINVYVKGDAIIEKGSAVTATGKGFSSGYGPGKGTGSGQSTATPSYGGIGYLQAVTTCYGSIFLPKSFGSPHVSASGTTGAAGGQIAITSIGNLRIDGTISSNGGINYGGTGGSILLSGASVLGVGSITANCVSSLYGGAGGRVAIYQTKASSLGFTGSVQVDAYYTSSKPTGHGTKYYQFAGSKERGGTIYFSPGSSAGTSFPMSADGSAKSAYANATVALGSGTLYLLADTKVYDLSITGGKINLQGHTIRVLSRNHKNGRGWYTSYANCVTEGGGKIIWVGGMTLAIR